MIVTTDVFPPDLPCVRFQRMITDKHATWYSRVVSWLGRRQYKVTHQWELIVHPALVKAFPGLDGATHIIIRPGFVWDGASIPRVFWLVFNPVNLLLLGSILHDHGYRRGFIWARVQGLDGSMEEVRLGEHWRRSDWDVLFRLITSIYNHSPIIAWVPWAIVRVAGWAAYRKG